MVQHYQAMSPRGRLLVNISIIAVVIISIFVFRTFATANPVIFSNETPVAGSTISENRPTVSVSIYNDGSLDMETAALFLNGSPVGDLSGSIPDFTLSYIPDDALADGLHTVTASVMDHNQEVFETSWSFTVGVGPALNSFAPADGVSVAITNPRITFVANDPDGIDVSSAQIKINGIIYPVQVKFREIGHWEEYTDACESSGEPTIIWVVDGYDETSATITASTSSLPDFCDVWVNMADQLGNVSTAEWSFQCMVAPAISNLAPVNGSSVNTAMPTISARVADNGVINAASIILKVDTIPVVHTFTPANGNVSYIPSEPLIAGNHTVYLEVSDTAGNGKTASWGFTVPQGTATYSDMTPSPGADVNIADPQISVKVSGTVNLNRSTLNMFINGDKVNATINFEVAGSGYDYKKGIIVFNPAALPEGANKVAVSIADSTGKPSATLWSFRVSVPPVISNVFPANNSIVADQSPTILATVTDNGTISNVIMTVNGDEVAADFNAGNGIVSYTPPTPFVNGTDQTVSITATDEVGASTTLTWGFHVQVYPEMPTGSECATCHEGYPVPNHPLSNCDGCHGDHQPIEDCGDCHNDLNWQHGPQLLNFADGRHGGAPLYLQCTDCHNAQYSYKIPSHPADNTAYHNTTTSFDICRRCHELSLTLEHSRYKDADNNNYTCLTCHRNSNADIIQAIENRQKNCDSCHGGASHQAVHETSALDENCVTCHINNLTMEHLENPKTQTQTLTCDTCHQSSKKEVNRTIFNNSLSCTGCHKQGHNVTFGDNVPGNIPFYPGFTWSNPIEADIFAGEPETPVGYELGQLVFSNRRNDITAAEIWLFYLDNLTDKGWTPVTLPAPQSGVGIAEFISGNRSLTLKYFNTLTSNGTGAEIGHRIEIWYK